jgi:hypothetical protein
MCGLMRAASYLSALAARHKLDFNQGNDMSGGLYYLQLIFWAVSE